MNKIVWRWIQGYEGFYQVSNTGLIKSFCRNKNGKLMKTTLSHKGYPMISFSFRKSTKTYTVHRLVAKAFIPNPESKPQINHKNGIKTDNNVYNLEWCTNLENAQHSWRELDRHGLSGEDNSCAILTELQVFKIFDLYDTGQYTQLELAYRFGVHYSTINKIIMRKNWPNIQRQTKNKNTHHKKLDNAQVKQIRQLYKAGEHTQRTLASMFNVSQRLIWNLLNYAGTWAGMEKIKNE